VEQELLTLPEHLSSPLTVGGVRVTRSLVLYVCFVDHCLSFCIYFFIWPLCCLFFFDIRILITPLVSYDSSYQSITPEVFRVFMLFYLFVVQYVTLTLFCLSVMVSTVPADYEPCEPHGLSSGVCVCCSIDSPFVCSVIALCLYVSEFYLLMLSTLVVRNNSTQHILHTQYKL
jgi:hypothetical protein